MKSLRLAIAGLLLMVSTSSFGVVAFFTETADKVRFEQYTSGTLALFRLPTPRRFGLSWRQLYRLDHARRDRNSQPVYCVLLVRQVEQPDLFPAVREHHLSDHQLWD